MKTLVQHGMVVQERGSSRYQLGPAVLRLGNVYLDTLELRSKAIPWAEELARRTGLAVRTGVLLVDDVVIIHHEPRPDGSRQMPEVGIIIPAHASALGKAMLAHLPDDEARLLRSGPLRSMTGETSPRRPSCRPSSPRSGSREWRSSRTRRSSGRAPLASPVFDSFTSPVGAIGVVTGPDPDLAALRDAVRETARALSQGAGRPSVG